MVTLDTSRFEHEDAAMAESLRSMDTMPHVCPQSIRGRKVWVGKEPLEYIARLPQCRFTGRT